jgi:hypothetical protein
VGGGGKAEGRGGGGEGGEGERGEGGEMELDEKEKKEKLLFFLSKSIAINKAGYCMSLIETTYKPTMCIFIVTKLY